ncbi:hypothetical protein [Streptomyces sp. NBC_01506]|uniref:hypothetical protein n=1 Tax=Streptomyces sp. NBC_01506 TaxID=2903887 RepID=UPI003868F090
MIRGRKQREIDRLRADREYLYERLEAAETDAAAHLGNVRRLAAQNVQLADKLDAARRPAPAVPEPAPAPVTDRSLLRRLDLSERARRSLAGQLATVQAANDAMCRDAVTAAGNLAATPAGA